LANENNVKTGCGKHEKSHETDPFMGLKGCAEKYTNRRAGAVEMQWHLVSIIPPPAGKVNIFYEKRAVCCAEGLQSGGSRPWAW
jgi:hypothetical protein